MIFEVKIGTGTTTGLPAGFGGFLWPCRRSECLKGRFGFTRRRERAKTSFTRVEKNRSARHPLDGRPAEIAATAAPGAGRVGRGPRIGAAKWQK